MKYDAGKGSSCCIISLISFFYLFIVFFNDLCRESCNEIMYCCCCCFRGFHCCCFCYSYFCCCCCFCRCFYHHHYHHRHYHPHHLSVSFNTLTKQSSETSAAVSGHTNTLLFPRRRAYRAARNAITGGRAT